MAENWEIVEISVEAGEGGGERENRQQGEKQERIYPRRRCKIIPFIDDL